eukprot:CAMPEP_0119086836 /NCGR_PEP_ID=MMETSP1178-20130426/139508_1 /TAXON_ID=33656 /ORGANISM="unid sp, Strain CCMP2000" /LENGTH=41 /DNA_ID= /DNA_START= /DNA_END= /DNA_ORIENTATION=
MRAVRSRSIDRIFVRSTRACAVRSPVEKITAADATLTLSGS